jgi:hypothetical protein
MSPEPYEGNLGDMLLRDGLVSNEVLEEALRRQRQTGQPLGRILVEMNAITEAVKLNFFHKRFGHDIVSLRDHEFPDILHSYIPRQTAVKYRVVPYKLEGDTLVVAMEDPSDLVILDNLKAQVGLKIRPVIASYSDIEMALEMFPDTGGGELAIEAPARGGVTNRVVQYLFFPLLAFTPLIVIGFMLVFSNQFQRFLLNPPWGFGTFDMVVSLVLIWGLWALFIYELDGLFVNPEYEKR